MGLLASAAICLMLAYCKTHTFLAHIWFSSTYRSFSQWIWFSSIYCSFSRWGRLVFSSILHFSNMCQWEFGIIIFFNTTTALALLMSRVRSTNPYLILKLLIFPSTGQLHDARHLPQYRCSLLPPDNGLFPPSDSLISCSRYNNTALTYLWVSSLRRQPWWPVWDIFI